MNFYYYFEKSMRDIKMFFKMFRFFFIGIFIIQIGLFSMEVIKKIDEIKDISIPVSEQKISKKAIINYYFDLGLGFTTKIQIPKEFIPMYRKLKYKKFSIDRELYKSHLDELTNGKLANLFPVLKQYFFETFYLQLLTLVLLIAFFIKSKFTKNSKFVRGTKLTPLNIIKRRLNGIAKKERKNIKIGDLNLIRSLETSHTLVLGSTGAGKSVLLNQMVDQLQKRKKDKEYKEKMIIYDVKGEYLSKWYDQGGIDHKPDIIFYPFDKRSINYSLFNDIKEEIDFNIIAKSLFESSEGNIDNFFYEAAGEVFRVGLIWLNENNKRTNRDILEFFSDSREDIIKKLQELPLVYHGAITYIESEKQGAGVLSSLVLRIKFLDYLLDSDGDFSFRDYIRDENDKRTLYLLNMAQYNLVFKPLITFVMNMMIREVLSLKDDSSKRVFFVIDEFGSLSKMDSIISFLKESRSKGGALILGNQDLGDVSRIYGQDIKSTFYNNFNTNFLFRVNDPTTADFLSKAIGEAEVYKNSGSSQMNSKNNNSQSSVSSQNKQERVLLASEFLNKMDFECVLKISGVGISHFKIIPSIFYDILYPYFLEKNYFRKDGTSIMSESEKVEEYNQL